jgi:hypothetical protein
MRAAVTVYALSNSMDLDTSCLLRRCNANDNSEGGMNLRHDPLRSCFSKVFPHP